MDEGLNYSLEARLRVALSAVAARASGDAASLVSTYGEEGCPPGELAEAAAATVVAAAEMLQLAIACERERGTGWARIAESISVDGGTAESVQTVYGELVSALRERLVLAWLDPGRDTDLPEGAARPAEAAARLDAWLAARPQLDEATSRHPDPDVRAHPVSTGLAAMSLAEHNELVEEAARRCARRDDGAEIEIGLYTRRVALLEWLLAEEIADPRAAGSTVLRDLLTSARRRLATLTG